MIYNRKLSQYEEIILFIRLKYTSKEILIKSYSHTILIYHKDEEIQKSSSILKIIFEKVKVQVCHYFEHILR